MRSFKDVQRDLHKLADELYDMHRHYEDKSDKLDIKSDKDEMLFELYSDILDPSEEALASLSDAIDVIEDCVIAEKDLEEQ